MEDTTMTNNNNHNIEPQSHSYPPGYVFEPTDDELIDFLKIKLESRNSNFKNNEIHDPSQDFVHRQFPDLNVYKQLPTPENLSLGCWKLDAGQKGWWFFTPRERKYPNGTTPNRKTSEGVWKATQAEKPIVKNNNVIGYKRTLVFYAGRKRIDWLMQEYRCTEIPNRKRTYSGDLKFDDWDDWVLCLIYKKHKARPTVAAVERQMLASFQSADEQAGDNMEQMTLDNNAQQAEWQCLQSSYQEADYDYDDSTESENQSFDHSCNQSSGSMDYDSNYNVHLASYCPGSSDQVFGDDDQSSGSMNYDSNYNVHLASYRPGSSDQVFGDDHQSNGSVNYDSNYNVPLASYRPGWSDQVFGDDYQSSGSMNYDSNYNVHLASYRPGWSDQVFGDDQRA